MTYEKSADVLDMAAQLQEQLNEQGRAQVAHALRSEQEADFDGNCVDCEDPLPPVRIAYGRCRCTPCQVAKEKQEKIRGRQ